MLLELRVALMGCAHASLAMKVLTVVAVRKGIARHTMEHVKVWCIAIKISREWGSLAPPN